MAWAGRTPVNSGGGQTPRPGGCAHVRALVVGAAARQHGGAAAPQHAVGAHIHAMKKMAYGEKSLRCGATPSPTASIPRYIARSHPSPELITYSSSIALPKLSNEPCNHSVITV